jgi:peptide/nickel transport system permease protein
MFGLIIITSAMIIAVLSPRLITHDPVATSRRALEPPSSDHWLGTDDLGRDEYSRLVYGSRVSMWVSLMSALLALGLGTPLGLLSGSYGGWVDDVIMRFTDIWFAFPEIVLPIAIVAALGTGANNVIIALGLIYAPVIIRLVRGVALSVREKPFVAAAKAIGESDAAIMIREILPNCLSPLIVQTMLIFSYAILVEAALSFLGLGTQPPTPSWGRMLGDARLFMFQAPWLAIFPGAAVTLTILGFNFFGDGLRDVLDVRARPI